MTGLNSIHASGAFSAYAETLSEGRVIRIAIVDGSTPISFAEVIRCWIDVPDFRSFFIDLLKQSPFTSFRWETPPVTRATEGQPFEFALVDSPEIALTPRPDDFAEHFVGTDPGTVIEFLNLGGDAILVVPCPDDITADYAHLASFLKNSSESQQHRLWELVGRTMQRRIGSKPVWLSTAGGGVAWLHVRLDDRPKYYAHAPYRNLQ